MFVGMDMRAMISAALRIERRLDLDCLRTELNGHLGNDVITPDA